MSDIEEAKSFIMWCKAQGIKQLNYVTTSGLSIDITFIPEITELPETEPDETTEKELSYEDLLLYSS